MKSTGKVTGIVSNLVTVETNGPVAENEICYINLGGTKLMAEVIKVNGKNAQVQVFESTRGLKNGDEVEFEGRMLEVTLGPGLLSSVYDGLQNDLTTMEGVFLKRGEYTDPLNHEKLWDFTPTGKAWRQSNCRRLAWRSQRGLASSQDNGTILIQRRIYSQISHCCRPIQH
jgi:V/A-type H+-transporting ATPase subunit A